jgi:hypothetical protein
VTVHSPKALPVAVPDQRPAGERPRLLARSLPWLLALVAAVVALAATGTPILQIATYTGYFAVAVVLPGTLVLRALFGSRGNWPEDLGLGAAAGLVVQLTGWALTAATGVEALLPVWIGLVLLLFAAVPRLRRHWRIENPTRLPLGWSWGMAAVFVLITLWAAVNFRNNPLPPLTFSYYQDLYYHLALVHEMTRTFPFQVPQVAGETLRYHYLSDADIASASLLTGIDPFTILLRLWILPIVFTAAVTFAALARAVNPIWWTGPVAAALGFVGFGLALRLPIQGGVPITLLSPSQVYSLPLIGLFTLIALEALRGKQLRWTWAALPVLAVACAGAKSSALPPLFAGVALAGLFLLVRRRRVPWVAAGLLGAIGVGVVVGLRLFAGGGAGTLQVQPLALLRWIAPYEETLGWRDGITVGGFLPPGFVHTSTAGRLFAVAVVVWWFLVQAPRFVGLVMPVRDVTLWLLGGMLLAGTAAAWVFWHPSASQAYFFAGVVPVGAVLTAAALARRVRNVRVALAAAAAGAICILAVPRTPPPAKDSFAGWAWTIAAPILLALAVAAVAFAIAVAVWRKRAVRALPAVLIAAVVGASLANGAVRPVDALLHGKAGVNRQTAVTADEMRGALWVEANTGKDDLIATNVHCVRLDPRRVCDARAFWVAGLGGRRTLIESWGYSDEAVADHGNNGLRYTSQPFHNRTLFDLNERAFTGGDTQDHQELHDAYAVKWLVADTRAGTVAPALARNADLRHTSGTVRIYELR